MPDPISSTSSTDRFSIGVGGQLIPGDNGGIITQPSGVTGGPTLQIAYDAYKKNTPAGVLTISAQETADGHAPMPSSTALNLSIGSLTAVLLHLKPKNFAGFGVQMQGGFRYEYRQVNALPGLTISENRVGVGGGVAVTYDIPVSKTHPDMLRLSLGASVATTRDASASIGSTSIMSSPAAQSWSVDVRPEMALTVRIPGT